MKILLDFLFLSAIVLFFSWLLAGTILFIQQVIEDFKENQ